MKKTEKEYKKILIIRIGAIGDVVHTTNTFRSIKQKYPEVEIHYLTYVDKSMLENDPNLAKVWWIDNKKFSIFSKYTMLYAKQLRQEKFDAVINLQPSLKTRFLALLSGIKKHYNYRKNNNLHAVKNYWVTAKRAFPNIEEFSDLRLTVSDDICLKMLEKIAEYRRPYIILNAGNVFARRQGRTYPVSQWITLGNTIQKTYNGTIFITGVNDDAEILKPIESIKNSVSFVGQLSIEENNALIKNVDLLISGDSGPLHIAAALGINVVGLYGSMPIKRTGPYGGDNCRVVLSQKECSPCNHIKCKYLKFTKKLYAPCMEMIKVTDIMEKIESFRLR